MLALVRGRRVDSQKPKLIQTKTKQNKTKQTKEDKSAI